MYSGLYPSEPALRPWGQHHKLASSSSLLMPQFHRWTYLDQRRTNTTRTILRVEKRFLPMRTQFSCHEYWKVFPSVDHSRVSFSAYSEEGLRSSFDSQQTMVKSLQGWSFSSQSAMSYFSQFPSNRLVVFEGFKGNFVRYRVVCTTWWDLSKMVAGEHICATIAHPKNVSSMRLQNISEKNNPV